jgi:hypothetical protein
MSDRYQRTRLGDRKLRRLRDRFTKPHLSRTRGSQETGHSSGSDEQPTCVSSSSRTVSTANRDYPSDTMTSRADTPLNARVIAPLVILAVWIILYAWRPWHLGFYHDDWFMARSFDVVEAERLFAQFPSRPLLVAVTLAAGRMLGADPFAWQALMVVSSLAVALLLAEVGRRLARALILDEIGAIAAGAAGACLWLALPWTLGFTVFVTAFNGLPGLLIFLGLCTLIMSRLPLWLRMTGAVSLSLALGLMFESLWGAPILMAFIPVLRRLLRDERGWVRELYVPAVLIAAQLLLLLYNRLWALAGMGQNKALDVSAAFNVFNQSLQRLSGEFGTSLVLHPTVSIDYTRRGSRYRTMAVKLA